MKEFILTQPYNSIEEMVNSGEMAVYVDELKQHSISKYAIVSRIGNRYDIHGNRIEGFIDNPFGVNVEELKTEGISMKYLEIEALIDAEVEKATAELKVKHEQEIESLKQVHELELANVKSQVKAEILAKLGE